MFSAVQPTHFALCQGIHVIGSCGFWPVHVDKLHINLSFYSVTDSQLRKKLEYKDFVEKRFCNISH